MLIQVGEIILETHCLEFCLQTQFLAFNSNNDAKFRSKCTFIASFSKNLYLVLEILLMLGKKSCLRFNYGTYCFSSLTCKSFNVSYSLQNRENAF